MQCKESKKNSTAMNWSTMWSPTKRSSSESSALPGSRSSSAWLQVEPSFGYPYSAFRRDIQANQIDKSLTWASYRYWVTWEGVLIFSELQNEVYRVEELFLNNHPLILVWMFGLVPSQRREEKRWIKNKTKKCIGFLCFF